MRFRGCPALRRMNHSFDPATHRCKCGRWEAGYAPKKAPVRPRAECQICERQQATAAGGRLGHHGYRRPGWGCIEGDCPGVGHAPYPATDALEVYRRGLIRWIADKEERLEQLRAGAVKELPFNWTDYVDRKKVERTTMIRKGEDKPRCGNYCVPDYDDLLRRAIAKIETEIGFAEGDLRRVNKRIAAANGGN